MPRLSHLSPIFVAVMLAGGCATSPEQFSERADDRCEDEFRACTRTPGDTDYCDAQLSACKAAVQQRSQRAAERKQGFEDFKSERDERRTE